MGLYEDAKLYDLVTASPEREGPFYAEIAEDRGGRVLELATGTGRVAAWLAERGLSVTGVDRSASMLAVARERSDKVRWIEGDMRTVRTGETYDLVFVTLNSLLHLHDPEDHRRFFDTVRQHLADDGVLAFDVFSPSVHLLARDPSRRYPMVTVYDEEADAELIVEETTSWDVATQVSHIRWYFSWPGSPDARVFDLHLRSLFPVELLTLLELHGFEPLARYGGFGGEPFTSQSPIQVVVARAV
ncbi:MAG: class I SAM-dependent methyltransferase [Deltaproteobacteria bacterium]|nr:MAG: class I SAM-dependent methyltransferase [Deltaproteobacteria bacterium]